MLADFIPQPAVNWWTVWVFSSVCLLSHCLRVLPPPLSQALSTAPPSTPCSLCLMLTISLSPMCAMSISLPSPTLSFSLPPCHPAPSFPLSLKSPSSPYSFLHFTAMSLLQMLAVSAPWAESQWWAPAGIQSTILAFSSKQLLLAVIKGSSFSISVWMGSLALGKTSTSAHPPILSGQEHIVSLCPDFDPIKPSHAIYRIGYKKTYH